MTVARTSPADFSAGDRVEWKSPDGAYEARLGRRRGTIKRVDGDGVHVSWDDRRHTSVFDATWFRVASATLTKIKTET